MRELSIITNGIVSLKKKEKKKKEERIIKALPIYADSYMRS